MKYGTISGINRPLSRIVFGCAIAPMLRGENVNGLLDEVYAQEITVFDTAENYGLSEMSLGQWMKDRKNREQLVLITKGCHPYDGKERVTVEDLKHDLEQSFERLGTDYIDIYFLHRDDPKMEVGPLVELLNEYHREGRLGAFGGSNWTHGRIAEANRYASAHGLIPFTVSSPNYGLCNQVCDPWGGGPGGITISGQQNAEARAWYVENGIPVFAYSSLGRGMFSGRVKSNRPEEAKQILDPFAVKGYCYPENFERLARAEKLASEKNCTVPQIALAWVLNQEIQVFPLASARSGERMAENVRALDISLSWEELAWLNLEPDGGCPCR